MHAEAGHRPERAELLLRACREVWTALETPIPRIATHASRTRNTVVRHNYTHEQMAQASPALREPTDDGRNKDKVTLGQGSFSRGRLGEVEERAERNGWPEKRGFVAL